MKKVIYLLGRLDDVDIEWMISAGERKYFEAGQVLMREGVASSELLILTEGMVDISVKGNVITTLGIGEIIGEIGLLDSRPPTATVIAQGDVRVLSLSYSLLNDRLRADSHFAARLYRALGTFLAQRMRSTTLMLSIGETAYEDEDEEDEEFPDEIDPAFLEEITLAGARFRWMLDQLK